VILRLLSATFPGKKEIADQLRSARVRRIDEEGSLEFQVDSAVQAAKVERLIPVEAEAPDTDGILVHFLLHVLDGLAAELEVYKDDLTPITRMPRADELDVSVLGK